MQGFAPSDSSMHREPRVLLAHGYDRVVTELVWE